MANAHERFMQVPMEEGHRGAAGAHPALGSECLVAAMIAWTRRHPVAQAVTLMGRRAQEDERGPHRRVVGLRRLEDAFRTTAHRTGAREGRVSMVDGAIRRGRHLADAVR